MDKCIEINISGKVQGVGYRYATLYKANELCLTGYVKNNYDSTVTIIAEGDEGKLNELVVWCHSGPPRAIVEKVVLFETNPQNYKAFRIR